MAVINETSRETLVVRDQMDLRVIKGDYLAQRRKYRRQVLVCGGAGCISSHCQEVKDALHESLANYQLEDEIEVLVTGCMGTCSLGPVILVDVYKRQDLLFIPFDY